MRSKVLCLFQISVLIIVKTSFFHLVVVDGSSLFSCLTGIFLFVDGFTQWRISL